MDKEFSLIMIMLGKGSKILETTLMAFFKFCQEDNFAKTLLYEDVSSYYTFDKLFKMFILILIIFTSKNVCIQKTTVFILCCVHLDKMADLSFIP